MLWCSRTPTKCQSGWLVLGEAIETAVYPPYWGIREAGPSKLALLYRHPWLSRLNMQAWHTGPFDIRDAGLPTLFKHIICSMLGSRSSSNCQVCGVTQLLAYANR